MDLATASPYGWTLCNSDTQCKGETSFNAGKKKVATTDVQP